MNFCVLYIYIHACALVYSECAYVYVVCVYAHTCVYGVVCACKCTASMYVCLYTLMLVLCTCVLMCMYDRVYARIVY